MGDDRVQFSTKNESVKLKICSYDGKRLEKSKAKRLEQFIDEKQQLYLWQDWIEN